MKTKIGLALGSGGARGYAHIGVLKALKEKNWPVDFITGSSIGALIGVLYSYYGEVEEVEEMMLGSYWKDSIKMMTPSIKSGVISGKKIRAFLEEFIGPVNLKDLKIPTGIVATDFNNSESVLITGGRASDAVHASLAFPLFIEPYRKGEKTLWDGGLADQVPTEAARKMGAERIIGVNLNSLPEKTPSYDKMNTYTIAIKAIRSLQYQMTKKSMQEADIEIAPELEPTVLLGFTTLIKKGEGKEIIKRGYLEAKKVIEEIEHEQ